MASTIEDFALTMAADRAFARGEDLEALGRYVVALSDEPDSLFAWFRVALLMARVGGAEAGKHQLNQVASSLAESGHLPLALCAGLELQAVDPDLGRGRVRQIARIYGAGSLRLGPRRRTIPPPLPEHRPDDIPLELPLDEREVLLDMARDACDAAAERWRREVAARPFRVPFYPLFSDLKPADLEATAQLLRPRSVQPGEVIIEQGEEGRALFMLARGGLRVERTLESGEVVQLAVLGAGALFGEMALLTDSPRVARVTCTHPSVVFELGRDELEALADRAPGVADVLAAYTRERMLRNVTATSELFRPLSAERREALRDLFRAEVRAAGETVIAEGELSDALRVVLSGAVRVTRRDGEEEVTVAELGPGQMFGEMSLLTERPASASVVAQHKTVLLALSRRDMHAQLASFPEVIEQLYEVAQRRQAANLRIRTGPTVAVEESELLI